MHRVVCPFTPQLSLVLINRPQRDGTLSWRRCTAAASVDSNHDLAVASPASYHSATAMNIVSETLKCDDDDDNDDQLVRNEESRKST